MAVSVDTVYQRVLGILNKEQRGYVTPQEFNLFANQAQLDIFEQYFYDINQFGRLHGNSTEFSDMLNILNEKIALFEENNATLVYFASSNGFWALPANLYKLGTVIYNQIEVERVDPKEYLYINSSPLSRPQNNRPIYVADTRGFKAYGDAELTSGVTCNYIKKPADVNWGYQIVFNEPLYNAATSVDFELHPSDETELVIKILELAGLLIKDISMYQVENQEDIQRTQQEKQ
tara:strand:- start:1016 stop:1714 length:699 start_codon:yes stop_codon:yes gene_type:complete